MAHSINDPGYPARVRVGAVNFEAVPRDKAATLEKMLRFIRDAADQDCELVVFPELALNAWGECVDCADHGRPCAWHLDEAGRCRHCGTSCAGVFEAAPGTWGARRMPVELAQFA